MARVRDRIDRELRQVRNKLSREMCAAMREGRFDAYMDEMLAAALRKYPFLKVYRGRPKKVKETARLKSCASARAPRRSLAVSKGRRKLTGK